MKGDRTGKWRQAFAKKKSMPCVGMVYHPHEFDTVHWLLTASADEYELFGLNVYQIDVQLIEMGGVEIHFVTDSVEVLKMLGNRAFPLKRLALAVWNLKQEAILDLGVVSSGRLLEVSSTLRIAPRLGETDAFEIRLIK